MKKLHNHLPRHQATPPTCSSGHTRTTTQDSCLRTSPSTANVPRTPWKNQRANGENQAGSLPTRPGIQPGLWIIHGIRPSVRRDAPRSFTSALPGQVDPLPCWPTAGRPFSPALWCEPLHRSSSWGRRSHAGSIGFHRPQKPTGSAESRFHFASSRVRTVTAIGCLVSADWISIKFGAKELTI